MAQSGIFVHGKIEIEIRFHNLLDRRFFAALQRLKVGGKSGVEGAG